MTTRRGFTTGREVIAYAAAQLVKTAAVYQFSPYVNGPLIRLMNVADGLMPVIATTLALSLFWSCLVLIFFLPARSFLKAAPESVVGPGRPEAIATSWKEAAAFFLAAMVQSLLAWGSNLFAGPYLYRPLFEAGQGDLVLLASFAVLAVNMAICFGIFVGLRRVFCRAP